VQNRVRSTNDRTEGSELLDEERLVRGIEDLLGREEERSGTANRPLCRAARTLSPSYATLR
jgi:hypothetical protein